MRKVKTHPAVRAYFKERYRARRDAGTRKNNHGIAVKPWPMHETQKYLIQSLVFGAGESRRDVVSAMGFARQHVAVVVKEYEDA